MNTTDRLTQDPRPRARSSRIARGVAPAVCGVLVIHTSVGAHAFEGPVHQAITEKIAGELGYKAAAVQLLVKGNLDSDKKESEAPGGEWYSPAAHFDNEAFSAGALRLRLKRELALASLETCDAKVSLVAIGRALHAIQDFYSHSNYIIKYPNTTSLADILSIADPSPADRSELVDCKTGKGPLTSGYYHYTSADVADNNQLWVLVPANRCLHDDGGAIDPGMNRDSSGRTGHAAARARAERASRAFLTELGGAIKARYGVAMLGYLKTDGSDDMCQTALVAGEAPVLHAQRADFVATVVPGKGNWGTWRRAKPCPAGTWASGFNLRVEPFQGDGMEGHDDSALNSVRLRCSDTSVVEPSGGAWGSWGAEETCAAGQVLTAAKLRVEGDQGHKDDTGANDVVFRCSDASELKMTPSKGAGTWGTEGAYAVCPANTAVCGLSIRVEENQGKGDDSAMNGLALHCCRRDAG